MVAQFRLLLNESDGNPFLDSYRLWYDLWDDLTRTICGEG
jgi:hypothetical protein